MENESGEDELAADATSVEVSYTEFAPETLRAIVDDLVTRDGTDYGDVEKTTEQKATALLRQLERGEAKLMFDVATESIGVVSAELLRRSQRSTGPA